METFQEWLTPIVCIVSGLAAIIAFFKTIKPYFVRLHHIQTAPDKLEEEMKSVESSLSDIKNALEAQGVQDKELLDKIDNLGVIEMTLLHDAIISIYCTAMKDGKLTESSYRRACELYALDGQSEYIDHIMDCLEAIHDATIKKENVNALITECEP